MTIPNDAQRTGRARTSVPALALLLFASAIFGGILVALVGFMVPFGRMPNGVRVASWALAVLVFVRILWRGKRSTPAVFRKVLVIGALGWPALAVASGSWRAEFRRAIRAAEAESVEMSETAATVEGLDVSAGFCDLLLWTALALSVASLAGVIRSMVRRRKLEVFADWRPEDGRMPV